MYQYISICTRIILMITVFTKLLGIALLHLLKSKVPACFAITWSAVVCNVLTVDLLAGQASKLLGIALRHLLKSNVPALFAIM